MKKIHIDCTNGISSDMVFHALIDLGADQRGIEEQWKGLELEERPVKKTYRAIQKRLEESSLPPLVKKRSQAIYHAIALAESEVHGENLETVHFHEVGRRQAVEYIVGICLALEQLDIQGVSCSEIHDGKGTIRCSHGEIPVPVPAVTAMKKQASFTFVTDSVETEMVTPSGLGILVGLEAQPRDVLSDDLSSCPRGRAMGTRDIGRNGLTIYLLEE